MGFGERFQNQYTPPELFFSGTNLGSAAIKHGQVVARDLSQSDTRAGKEARLTAAGIATAVPSNLPMLAGIAHHGSLKSVAAGQDCSVVSRGLCQALVYVPPAASAPATIPKGTRLAVGSEWDATNDTIKVGKTIGTTFHAGVLEPVIYPADLAAAVASATFVAYPAANPFAILMEALTPATAATVTKAWVFVCHRGPQHALAHLYLAENGAAADTHVLARTLGPGAVVGAWAHPASAGAGGTIDVSIAPAQATPDVLSVFQASETISIANDTADGVVMGTTVEEDGNIDPTWGTNARQGLLLASEAARTFPGNGLITCTVDAASTDLAKLLIGVELCYY